MDLSDAEQQQSIAEYFLLRLFALQSAARTLERLMFQSTVVYRAFA